MNFSDERITKRLLRYHNSFVSTYTGLPLIPTDVEVTKEPKNSKGQYVLNTLVKFKNSEPISTGYVFLRSVNRNKAINQLKDQLIKDGVHLVCK